MAAQSQTAPPDFDTPIPLSDTVKTTIAAFPDATPVTAWMLVRGVLTFHDEYGNYLAKRLVNETGPSGGKIQAASIWLEEVAALFDPAKVHEIHGKLFILGLSELDAELAKFLDQYGFRDALKRELLEQPFEALFHTPADPASSPIAPRKAWLYLADASDSAQIRLLETRDSVLWGANPNTRAGDLVFMYLTRPDTQIAYVFRAQEDAQDASALRSSNSDWHWDYSVQLGEKIQLSNPILWDEIRNNPDLSGWSLQRNVQGAMRRKRDIGEEGFYPALRALIVDKNPQIETQLRGLEANGETATPSPTDNIIFRTDAATDIDQLGRAGFADALATWLNRIWGENYTAYTTQLQTAYKTGGALPQSSSFIVHLHGPWGAGKTSLLRLMEKALKNSLVTIGGKPQRWTVVWFNAWRNRQIDPVWWPPLDRVYRELVQSPSTDLGFWAWETWWRLGVNGLGENPLVLGLGIVAVAGLFFWLTGNASGDNSWLASLQSIGGIIGLAGTLGAGILTLSRSLFTASSAQNFARLAQDPMEKVRTHFRAMMDRANHPVMVFIDDLDRCQPEYVVRLLESLQTLFNDPRVFYVIAADRRWLYECFEIVYKDFKTTVREPGRRTGYLFLEKIFQMSISVPAMSGEVQQAYLDHLYQRERHEVEHKITEASRQAEADFAEATTTQALVEKLETPQADPDPLIQQVRREAAVRRLASQKVSADIEYFLHPFASLLERNPRAMKRLVNAYSVYLALAMLADVQLINNEEKKKRFALWTILSLRWPALAEKLEDDPEALPNILEKKADGLDPDLTTLVQDEEVQRLLHGEAKDVSVALDVATIERLWGLQANTSTPVIA
ncbi:MAG: hypothetical protein H6636_05475 [Anaerolineales bacterium]|nr:hypothetical protein [Anaerolineales bacterium]